MNFAIAPPIDISVEPPRTVERFAPQIIWPTMVLGERGYIEGDLGSFPEEDMFRERRKRGFGGAMSVKFRDAVRLARERVWFVDDYLLDCDESASQLAGLFLRTGAPDIRLATAAQDGTATRASNLKALEVDLRKENLGGPPRRIQILLNLRKEQLRGLPDMHDRFAIIDDVLWHCGATIGGLHRAINAMSFGWSAQETKAIPFFERLWKVMEDDDA
jgi:hypothetical protein